MQVGHTREKSGRIHWKALVLAFGVIGAAAVPAFGDQVSGLAKRLASLRSEVEALSSDLSQREDDLRNKLRSLSRQKADLKLDLQREETRLRKTRLMIEQKKELIDSHTQEGAELKPIFNKAVEQIREYISRSLPFRKGERLTELRKLEDQLSQGMLKPEQAISRLWSFIEDELRLTRETGMYRQTVTVDGKEQLADVVRVGMVMLYFRTNDEQVGFADKTGGKWTYRVISDEEKRRRILDLFEAQKKQIRNGFFELPNALPEGAVKK